MGIEWSSLGVTVADGTFRCYVARPVASAPSPVLIVLQEIFGVNSDLRRTCEEWARDGYIAVAPELFWREAPGLDLNSWSEPEWARALELYQNYDVDRGVSDIQAAIEASHHLPGASGRIGVTGFCLGGLMTFLTAVRTTVDAAAAYYGAGIDQHLDEASGIGAPMVIHLGDQDEFIPEGARHRIVDRFGGSPLVAVHVYAGCSHAFARHTGTHYDAAAATLANGRTRELFNRELRLE